MVAVALDVVWVGVTVMLVIALLTMAVYAVVLGVNVGLNVPSPEMLKASKSAFSRGLVAVAADTIALVAPNNTILFAAVV